MPITEVDLVKRFDHHPPSNENVIRRHQEIREGAKNFARLILAYVPEGREQSMALTDVENAMMHANAGIARNQDV